MNDYRYTMGFFDKVGFSVNFGLQEGKSVNLAGRVHTPLLTLRPETEEILRSTLFTLGAGFGTTVVPEPVGDMGVERQSLEFLLGLEEFRRLVDLGTDTLGHRHGVFSDAGMRWRFDFSTERARNGAQSNAGLAQENCKRYAKFGHAAEDCENLKPADSEEAGVDGDLQFGQGLEIFVNPLVWRVDGFQFWGFGGLELGLGVWARTDPSRIYGTLTATEKGFVRDYGASFTFKFVLDKDTVLKPKSFGVNLDPLGDSILLVTGPLLNLGAFYLGAQSMTLQKSVLADSTPNTDTFETLAPLEGGMGSFLSAGAFVVNYECAAGAGNDILGYGCAAGNIALSSFLMGHEEYAPFGWLPFQGALLGGVRRLEDQFLPNNRHLIPPTVLALMLTNTIMGAVHSRDSNDINEKVYRKAWLDQELYSLNLNPWVMIRHPHYRYLAPLGPLSSIILSIENGKDGTAIASAVNAVLMVPALIFLDPLYPEDEEPPVTVLPAVIPGTEQGSSAPGLMATGRF